MLIKSSLIYLVSSVINKGLPFILLPILTKYLTPEEYGIIAMFQLSITVFYALVGEDGVSIMYSEGKGASKSMAQELDQSLQHYSKVFADCFGYDYSKDPGSGSGGGVVSAGQHFLNAKMEFGSDYFLENVGLEKEIRSADLVITAEGMICEQTIYNKAPIAVAKLAKKYDIPVVSVNALLGKNYELVFNHGIDAVISRRVNETSIMGMNDITEIAKQFGNECLQNGKITISKKVYLYEKI